MTHGSQLKEKVRKLRTEGKTFSEILKKINIDIPKSTLSNWCIGVSLPPWHQERIDKLNKKNFNKAQRAAWATNKIKRERLLMALLESSESLLDKLKDKDVRKMLLAVLYLGEGTKWRSHSGLVLGSSDPDIICLYIKLLKMCYGLSLEKLRCRISYRADQNLHVLESYWSRVTGISLKNFYKTIPDPRTIGKPTRREEYKGVCVISCAGTHIQLELEAIPKLILKGL